MVYQVYAILGKSNCIRHRHMQVHTERGVVEWVTGMLGVTTDTSVMSFNDAGERRVGDA